MDISITRSELEAALSPWTIREHGAESIRWRTSRARTAIRFHLKRLGRAIGSTLLPGIKSTHSHRDPEYVDDHFSRTWARYDWPDPSETPSRKTTVNLQWDGTGYETLRFGRRRCHLLGLAKVVERLQPASVLEVGAGPGMNLIALSVVFPEIEYAGAELTARGVRAARSFQDAPLPEHFKQIAPLPVRNGTAHRNIRFEQADVQKLPFPDAAFDLVFTRLAVEQMEQIRDRAFAEIHRVAKSHVVFIEPFPDFNRDPLQILATKVKNYISLGIDELSRYGFEPVFRFGDWPQKITNGAGMVVCRKVQKSNVASVCSTL
jgi:SAM-dependent methyltransferase